MYTLYCDQFLFNRQLRSHHHVLTKVFFTSPLQSVSHFFLPSFFLYLLTVSWVKRVVDLFRLSLGGWCETAVVLFSRCHWIYIPHLLLYFFHLCSRHRLFWSSFFFCRLCDSVSPVSKSPKSSFVSLVIYLGYTSNCTYLTD